MRTKCVDPRLRVSCVALDKIIWRGWTCNGPTRGGATMQENQGDLEITSVALLSNKRTGIQDEAQK
jgi:hypothetical protein